MSDVSTWSATANANNAASPNGFPENMPPSGVNDSCREVMAAVKRADLENAKLAGANAFTGSNTFSAAQTFNHLVTLEAGANIASAATIDLTAATGNCPRITGTTATSAVTMNTGQQMIVVADGAWPLTYHATTNKLNTGGASYTCSAGDIIEYHKDLSGVVHGVITPKIVQPVTTVASATSTALAGTLKQYITGTTSITAFTGVAGATYHCECIGLLPLVHSVGLSILNWGLNVTLSPNTTFDVYMVTDSTCVVFNINFNNDYKRINTANGYGSTNNAIRRLTNIVDNSGGSVTYADSAANGASFTVNAEGKYAITYSDQFNASANMGISLNSNQLTTSIQNITQAHILAITTTPAANQIATCTATVFIAAGGVVRPHTTGADSGTATSGCLFTMARVK